MKLTPYQSEQLKNLVESKLKQNDSGILTLETKVDSWHKQRKGILFINNRALVYAGLAVPNNQQFAKILGTKLKSKSINAAIAVASKKLINPKSVRELISILVKLKVFTWESIEAYVYSQVVSILERFEAYPGEAKWYDASNFDFCLGEDGHGLNWIKLKQDLNYRAKQWASLAPTIPTMDTVPYIGKNNLAKLELLKANNPQIGEHIEAYVDGQRTLIEIASAIGKDPLKVANSYANWVKSGIISCDEITSSTTETPSPENTSFVAEPASQSSVADFPLVLSVDDSPIVQVSIKRALKGHYNLVCASKAVDALNILAKQSVDLLLLDLTMPDIDGLEFCKKIRQIPKFYDLPIIMVTARDGLINKMKGQIAGTNGYLTKPFTPKEILEVVSKYIKVHKV